MNIHTKFFSISTKLIASFLIIGSIFFIQAFQPLQIAQAAIVPTVSLSSVGSSSMSLSVHGDPNSAIILHRDSSLTTLGTTDSVGNYTAVVGIDSYGISCGQIAYVVVDNQQSPTISWAPNNGVCNNNTIQPSNGTLSFSQNNVEMNVGQSIGVTLSGNGGYSITSNPSPNIISAVISGNVITLSALAFGGSNIRVCEIDNQCATLNVIALGSGLAQITTTLKPSLVSINIASNNANGQFMGTGNTLSITFNLNESASSVSATMAGSPIGVSGYDVGPYSIIYKVTGVESSPIPLNLTFTDGHGVTTKQAFAIGTLSSVISTTSVPPVTSQVQSSGISSTLPVGCTATTIYSTVNGQSCETNVVTPPSASPISTHVVSSVVPSSTTVSTGYVFKSFLSLNSTGDEVTQLQKKLTALGVYSGPITGKFGPLTETAVKLLQKKHGLTQAGYVGPGTRALLNQ